MEGITDFEQWIREMRSELGQQQDTARQLAATFVESNMQLIRHDQVARLEVLKYRINKEVEGIEQVESAAQTGYTKGALLDSGLTFVLGSLVMNAMGCKDSLKIAAQMAGSALSRKVPFGTVLIGIGKKGIPEDVRVIPVSRLARESKRSETDIEANLKRNGYLMMALEVFIQALDRVEREILDGSLSLPIKISKITKQITR